MKKFMKNAFNALSSSRMRGSRSVSVLIVGIAVTLLAACGGGGGGGSSVVTPPTPVPTTYTETITCPGGDKQTATADSPPAALTAAEKLCAKPTLLSLTPANGATNVNPSNVELLFASSSSFRIPTASTLRFGTGPTLLPNQVLIPVTVSTVLVGGAPDPKKLSIKPTVALAFGQVYSYAFDLYDSIGNLLQVSGSFTTASAPFSCAFPMVKHVSKDACIYPMDVQKVVPAVELATSMTQVTDSAFLAATASGDAYLIDVGIKMTAATSIADRERALVYAIYRQNGKYYIKPLFKDTLTSAAGYDSLIIGVLTGFVFDRVQGDVSGLLLRDGSGACYRSIYDAVNLGFGSVASNACPVWK